MPLTARDVAFTYNYIIDNGMTNFTSYSKDIKHVTAVDDATVRMECSAAKADMLIAANVIYVLPEHVWSKVSPKAAGTTFANTPPIVGSGPFQCVQFTKGGYTRMVANKGYWGGTPKVDEVYFQNYTNADTMAQEMKSGRLDACTGLLDAQLRVLKNAPGVTAEPIVVNAYEDLVFNCYVPPAEAKESIDKVNDELHLGLPADEFKTIGGWALDIFGKIPKTGDIIKWGNIEIEIIDADKRKIQRIKIRKVE